MVQKLHYLKMMALADKFKNKSILLIGPTANSLNTLNGAWTHTWQGLDESYNNKFPTIKQALENKFNKVYYYKGFIMKKMVMNLISQHQLIK